jgi:hypothetical protein
MRFSAAGSLGFLATNPESNAEASARRFCARALAACARVLFFKGGKSLSRAACSGSRCAFAGLFAAAQSGDIVRARYGHSDDFSIGNQSEKYRKIAPFLLETDTKGKSSHRFGPDEVCESAVVGCRKRDFR